MAFNTIETTTMMLKSQLRNIFKKAEDKVKKEPVTLPKDSGHRRPATSGRRASLAIEDDSKSPRTSGMRKSRSAGNVLRSSSGDGRSRTQKPRKSPSASNMKYLLPRRNGSNNNLRSNSHNNLRNSSHSNMRNSSHNNLRNSSHNNLRSSSQHSNNPRNNNRNAEWAPHTRVAKPRSMPRMPRYQDFDDEEEIQRLDIIENMSFVDSERRKARRSPSPPRRRPEGGVRRSERTPNPRPQLRSASDHQPRERRRPPPRRPIRSTSNDNLMRGKRRNAQPPRNHTAPSTVSTSRTTSSSIIKKEVSFNQEVAIKEVTPIAVLTNNKLERVWFLEKELDEMLDSAYDIVDQIEADEASDLDSDDNSYDGEKKRREQQQQRTDDIRGLEGLINTIHQERALTKKDAWKSVFSEQTNQWGRGRTGILDDRAISMVYKSKTNKCRVDAIGRAKQDEKDVQVYLKSARFEHLRAMKRGGYRRGRQCKSCLAGSNNEVTSNRRVNGRTLRIATVH